MKKFEVFSEKQFDEMVLKFKKYFISLSLHDKPFKPLIITSKAWRKPKTSAQHRQYWAALSELKKAFRNNGTETNEDELHQYVKYKAGFTTVFDGVTIVRSIADDSEDATTRELAFLIDFIVRFAADNLDYKIRSGDG